MTYKLDLYIGSDNGTRRIRRDYLDKIVKWADENFPNGYTLLKDGATTKATRRIPLC